MFASCFKPVVQDVGALLCFHSDICFYVSIALFPIVTAARSQKVFIVAVLL